MNNAEILKRAAELLRQDCLRIPGSDEVSRIAAALEAMAERMGRHLAQDIKAAITELADGRDYPDLLAAVDLLAAPQPISEARLTKVIAERDEMEERATALAEAVGEYVGVDVGEWSSANDPISAAMEAMAAHPRQAPEGWQLVPIDPTPEMVDAGFRLGGTFKNQWLCPASVRLSYRAMLADAPKWEGK